MSNTDSDGPALRPVEDLRTTLAADTGHGTRIVVDWFAALTSGDFDTALSLMTANGSYFLLRQRKTIANAEFITIMKGLVGPTFTRPVAWSLGEITEQENRIAAMAGSHAPLTRGGVYENLYHFLFRTKNGLIDAVYEFGDTARSGQTFAKPPGEA